MYVCCFVEVAHICCCVSAVVIPTIIERERAADGSIALIELSLAEDSRH